MQIPQSSSSAVEHELLSVVLELIPFVVFWKDCESRYLGCNAAFAALAGLDSPADIVGLTDFDLPWAPEETEAYRADDRQVVDSGQAKLHIVEKQTTDEGGTTWLDTSKVPLRDVGGNVIGVLGVYADITDQRENEEELERTRRYLEDAIRAMDSGIVLYDEEERFVFSNDRYLEMYGMTPEMAPPGRKYEAILRAFTDQNPQIADAEGWIQERLDKHREVGSEWLQSIGDRTIRVSDSRTESGGVVSLRTDVSAMKAIEAQLRDAKEAAESANEAKSAFLANMSHEIRTPMSAILGFTDLLIEDARDPESLHALATIKRNGENLMGLINDILDLSKVESGNLGVVLEDCSPDDVVQSVAGLLSIRAKEQGVQLKVEMQGPIPSSIRTDGDRLRQVLVNLVGNALKFTSEGSVTIRTGWVPQATGGVLRFEVQDTGIGMTDEQLARVFRPFEQADSSTTRIFGGTGLGLTISKRLAELLGGEITARSVEGEGSVFALELPVREDVTLSGHRGAQCSPVAASSSDEPLAGRLDGTRLLLVEDGRDNQRLITRVLTRAGAQVDVCEDGIEALEAVAAYGQEIDAVLMDMQMPRLDGYGATRELRARGFGKPIVALTAHAMGGDKDSCLAAGCTDYLTKPVHFPSLVETCLRLTRRSA